VVEERGRSGRARTRYPSDPRVKPKRRPGGVIIELHVDTKGRRVLLLGEIEEGPHPLPGGLVSHGPRRRVLLAEFKRPRPAGHGGGRRRGHQAVGREREGEAVDLSNQPAEYVEVDRHREERYGYRVAAVVNGVSVVDEGIVGYVEGEDGLVDYQCATAWLPGSMDPQRFMARLTGRVEVSIRVVDPTAYADLLAAEAQEREMLEPPRPTPAAFVDMLNDPSISRLQDIINLQYLQEVDRLWRREVMMIRESEVGPDPAARPRRKMIIADDLLSPKDRRRMWDHVGRRRW
jgi:hypothetical protein